MPAIASAVRRRFWLPGVASRLTVVLDARHCFGRPPAVLDVWCCESPDGGSGCPPLLRPSAGGSGCPVLRVACRRFWMSGVASRLPAVLDARRRSLRFGTGELRSAPALPSGPAPSFAPDPLRPHSETIPSFAPEPLRASLRLHPGPAPEPLRALSRPHPGPAPEPLRASPRNHSGLTSTSSRTRPEPVPERVVHRVPGRLLLINYRKLWPEICRKAPGIGYFCEKQP